MTTATADDIKKIQAIGKANGWNEIELRHALDNLENEYDNECVTKLMNGRELHSPAYPEECSYVRITQQGYELGYWTSTEWAEDAECVMGAIMGAAHGN